jgi:hypothetical protein
MEQALTGVQNPAHVAYRHGRENALAIGKRIL